MTDDPYVCPGCHAVAEPCAPDCIDDAIRRDAENELEMQERWLDEDDDQATESRCIPRGEEK